MALVRGRVPIVIFKGCFGARGASNDRRLCWLCRIGILRRGYDHKVICGGFKSLGV